MRSLLAAAKIDLFSWFGILGGALTLFSNLQGFLDFTAWAEWLTEIWALYVVSVWDVVFERFDLKLETQALMMMTMAIFVSCLALGARLSGPGQSENWPPGWNNILHWNVPIAVVLYLLASLSPQLYYQFPIFGEVTQLGWLILVGVGWFGYVCAILVGLSRWPRLHAFVVAVAMLVISEIFGGAPLRDQVAPNVSELVSVTLALAFAIISGLIVLGIAPPRAFVRRLIFTLVGVALLVTMSEISKLGLSTDAPNVG